MMQSLKKASIETIHHATIIQPIKKITEIHDLIDLNLTIQQEFKDHKFAPIWDLVSLKAINQNRCEVMVFWHKDFRPFSVLDQYNRQLIKLLNIISLRTQQPII